MDTKNLERLYQSLTGHAPEWVEELAGASSNRHYFRLKKEGNSLIGVIGTSIEENRAFLYMDQHFSEKGLPVPKVYAASSDGQCYLQEDLGDKLLFDAIAHGRDSGSFDAAEQALLEQTIRMLPKFQFKGAENMDFNKCYPTGEFDLRSILWDLNNFKYCFLKAAGLDFQEDHLEDDFQRLADVLLESNEDTFMYHDFQSRNVILKGGKPYFIDFQGGRKGPYFYDVASFLWQAKANYSSELREHLLECYLEELRNYTSVDKNDFRKRLRHFVLFHLLQVLGAYGFRGYFEKKPHFIESVPYAIGHLRTLLKNDFNEYPYLCNLLQRLTELERFKARHSTPTLKVKVVSFAYPNGIPADDSGNGGGYVFDCRAIHNPGRYDCYKPLTGLDEPVIRFLEADGEITLFLTHVYALADAHVIRYIERGLSNLMICFGCTGGRHRSVYAAQHVAEYLNRKWGIEIQLEHREQEITQHFNAR